MSDGGGPPEGGAAAGPGLTTGALARRLGVSPTTLRSWDRRYGIGAAVRTGGRHRRWTPEDVAVLEEMCRLTASGVPPSEAARAAQAGAARSAGEGTGPKGVRAEEDRPGTAAVRGVDEGAGGEPGGVRGVDERVGREPGGVRAAGERAATEAGRGVRERALPAAARPGAAQPQPEPQPEAELEPEPEPEPTGARGVGATAGPVAGRAAAGR
ncbi:MerR family transcriptional regulator, partial [Streptomyces sp. NRRL S-31]|uniref:MerR family transcriptional regulator n=1 Tax=Streptomyces sp. NRRL S-31 TaxID=1463898 RepID=UPI0004C93E78